MMEGYVYNLQQFSPNRKNFINSTIAKHVFFGEGGGLSREAEPFPSWIFSQHLYGWLIKKNQPQSLL